ncbi:thioesterase-like superfamily-domain-containing protein [Daldinia loculata]|uniref:thioesterase-like superfamily-domain-containing protein n=1 Tax=Daldinia loculata TaxID=103429 RepID=UPI0020C21194|nr:thioesterase-like superfamily-domain-containing protein [Daldinia loculata]KAI1643059.1 thioesterase-like superfamily-domain-containing protein [Daldinia loculata]
MPPRPRLKPTYTLRLLSPVVCRQPAPRVESFASFSSKYSSRNSSTTTKPVVLPLPPSKWYSDLKARIGKCIMFGCTNDQALQAAAILRVLGTEWRELTAGAEGFLTGGHRGLENQQVVWGEMDSFGHVNNTNYIRYAESARVNWIIHFASVDPGNGTRWRELMTPKGTGLIMKSIKAEYKFPMTYPDTIAAYHKLRSQPSATDTSLVLDCIILSHLHRRVAARTEEDIVIYDYGAAQKTSVPPFALGAFQDVWRRQEEETREARQRIWELVKRVEGLEKGTWDRPGAVEDLGGKGGVKKDDSGIEEVLEDDVEKEEEVRKEVKEDVVKKSGAPTNTIVNKVRSLF